MTGKILILGSYGPSLYRFRGRLIADLSASGFQVVATAPDHDPDGSLQATLNSLGSTYRQAPIQRTGTNPLRDWVSFVKLAKLFREEQPNAVLAYTTKPVIYGVLAAWLVRVPVRVGMITGMGYAFSQRKGIRRRTVRTLQLLLYRIALPQASAVLIQNEDDRETLQHYGLAQRCRMLKVISGSGVDTSQFIFERLRMGYANRPVFLMIARLIRDKGIFEYVEAATRVKARYPGAVFQLVGRREDHPEGLGDEALSALVNSGVIEHLPRTEDVRPYFANCSVYVLPSYREGMPRTVLEAMAIGRPAITTEAPGCRSTIIDGESGLLVPVGDVEALAKAMEEFCKNPARIRPMGEAAHRRAREVFDVAGVNKDIADALGVENLVDSRENPAA